MTSPDQVPQLMPITFLASGIEPLIVAVAINDAIHDPCDFGPTVLRTIIRSNSVNIKLDPYLPPLAKTKHSAEACR